VLPAVALPAASSFFFEEQAHNRPKRRMAIRCMTAS
jgi:hypothetical protein